MLLFWFFLNMFYKLHRSMDRKTNTKCAVGFICILSGRCLVCRIIRSSLFHLIIWMATTLTGFGSWHYVPAAGWGALRKFAPEIVPYCHGALALPAIFWHLHCDPPRSILIHYIYARLRHLDICTEKIISILPIFIQNNSNRS